MPAGLDRWLLVVSACVACSPSDAATPCMADTGGDGSGDTGPLAATNGDGRAADDSGDRAAAGQLLDDSSAVDGSGDNAALTISSDDPMVPISTDDATIVGMPGPTPDARTGGMPGDSSDVSTVGISEVIAGISYADAIARGDPAVSHTFVLFGTKTLYISHLPLFQPPHDYQVVMAVTLETALGAYLQDRTTTGSVLYTAGPAPFVLPTLIAPGAASSFRVSADVYRGDLEQGGLRIASGALSAPRSIHFRRLDPTAPRPPELVYLLFGSSSEAFLVHVFTTRPDFDQILAVVLPTGLATDSRLTDGVQVHLPGSVPTTPLDAGAPVTARIADSTDLYSLQVTSEIWRDTADLQ
jgi:hypothetical protein